MYIRCTHIYEFYYIIISYIIRKIYTPTKFSLSSKTVIFITVFGVLVVGHKIYKDVYTIYPKFIFGGGYDKTFIQTTSIM